MKSTVLLLICLFLSSQDVTASSKPSTKPTPFGPKSAASLPRQKASLVSKPTSTTKNSHKASIATSIFNLANNVAGAGVLTLAAGKASGTGWIPSILVCTTLAFCSAHTFTLIGQACELTGEDTFKGLWAKAFGNKTAWIVDSMVFTHCFFVSIIFIGLLGDIFSALMAGSGNSSFWKSRTGVILFMSSCVLWPLNMIRDLSALGFTSILGLVAVLYTNFFIVFRAMDGSYSITEPIGKFVNSVAFTPSFDKSTLWNFDLNSLVLVSNLGLAFMAHYNGPTYWKSLQDATTPRFKKMVFPAYAILALVYTSIMVAGYATFGDVCQGNILLNYSPQDILSTLGRLATALSITFGFPLLSNGCREGLKNASSALGIRSISNPNNHIPLVTCLLIMTTSIAICVKDIKVVAGLTGAIMGSSLVYICPTLLYGKLMKQAHGADSIEYKKARRNMLFIPFGIFTACMGVTMTLKSAAK